jgi:carbamoyl-phosphate synthase small subunit
VRPWLRALVAGHATSARPGSTVQLAQRLREAGVPAIAGIDTRALARHLRDTGSQRALLTAPGETDVQVASLAVARLARWEDQDFVSQMGPAAAVDVGQGDGPRVAVLDLGLKRGILRALDRRGIRARVFPPNASAAELLAPDLAGAVLSPGPGDPARLGGPLEATRALVASGRPLLGICLGHQLIGLAAGAATRRLRFGHHGANHPVLDLDTGRVRVTAQNHVVEVVGDTLPPASGFRVTQRNLNDGTVEGLRHRELPIETVQYHPEGAPGPLDATDVFDRFAAALCR